MKDISKEKIIEHMNSDHMNSIINMSKKYSEHKTFTKVEMVDIDSTGMYFLFDDTHKHKINFPHPVEGQDLVKMVMTMSKNASDEKNAPDAVLQEIQEYMASFKSVVLGTLSPSGKVNATYAPCVKHGDDFYIFISEIAEHYDNLKAHPNSCEVLFLEDESDAASPLARKRIRFQCTSQFIEKNEQYNTIMDAFEKHLGGVFNAVKNMKDFHIVHLQLLEGRFVKGFGQAFSIKGNEISHLKGDKKAHGK
ncbi:MAG: HugZ family heme oxygenase [Desulfovibrionaceae bacterium]